MQTSPNLEFWHWFQSLSTNHRVELVGIASMLLVAIAVIFAILINALHRRRAEIGLKREMLDRGMSAENIATVMAASPAKSSGDDSGVKFLIKSDGNNS